MDLKRINYKNFKNALENMSVSDYKSFLIALISFEKSLSYETSEKIYNEFINHKTYASIFEINQMLEHMNGYDELLEEGEI